MRALRAVIALACFATAHAAPLTFHKDIEPILQKHCQSCYRPGESAPMSLLTFAQNRP